MLNWNGSNLCDNVKDGPNLIFQKLQSVSMRPLFNLAGHISKGKKRKNKEGKRKTKKIKKNKKI